MPFFSQFSLLPCLLLVVFGATAQGQAIRRPVGPGTQPWSGVDCVTSLSPGSAEVSQLPGTGSFAVNAASGCRWVAKITDSTVGWLNLSGQREMTGEGPGTVGYTYLVGEGGAASANISVNEAVFVINRLPVTSCTPQIYPGGAEFDAKEQGGSFTVFAAGLCVLSATTDAAEWITVYTPNLYSLLAKNVVTFGLAANPSTSPRTGHIFIGGQTYTVTQAGRTACTPVIEPKELRVTEAGGRFPVHVTTGPACQWSVEGVGGVLSVEPSGPYQGSTTLSLTVQPLGQSESNYVRTIWIAGTGFDVHVARQEAGACVSAVNPAEVNAGPGVSSGSVQVVAPGDCKWPVTWGGGTLDLPGVTRGSTFTGPATLRYALGANTLDYPLVGKITAGTKSTTITQSSAKCAPVLAPNQNTPELVVLMAEGMTGQIEMLANPDCSWSATSSDPTWLTVTTPARGPGALVYTAAVNNGQDMRAAAIQAGQNRIRVVQVGRSDCAKGISTQTKLLFGGGGSDVFRVAAEAGCHWSVASLDPEWLTISGPSSGTGPAEVPFDYRPNPTTGMRMGLVAVGTVGTSVRQQGSDCVAKFNPAAVLAASAGGSYAVAWTLPTSCIWNTTSSDPSWLNVAPAMGGGSGSASFTVAANTGRTMRTAEIRTMVGTVQVTQAGVAECPVLVSPGTMNLTAAGGTGSFQVSASPGCGWSLTNSAPEWLTITSALSGSGPGTVTFSYSNNATQSPRTANVMAGSSVITIQQAGAGCSATLEPAAVTVGGSGGTGTIRVAMAAGCTWSASSGSPGWLTVTEGGSGNGSVSYTAAGNNSAEMRTGSLLIAGQAVTVVQEGRPECAMRFAPASASVGPTAGTGSFRVQTGEGCGWTVYSSSPDWLTVFGSGSGSGPGTVSYAYTASTLVQARTATINAGSASFAVAQAGVSCTALLEPSTLALPPAGGTGTVAVALGSNCVWTAVSSAPAWLMVTGGGTGPGTIGYTVAANQSPALRSGTMDVGGQQVKVSQEGRAECAMKLTPAAAEVTAAAGEGTFRISTGADCPWTVGSDDPAWVRVKGPASGTGPAVVNYEYTANTSARARLTGIQTGGGRFEVKQAAAESCAMTLSPTAAQFGATGGGGRIEISTEAGCSWKASTSADWLKQSSSWEGRGKGSVTYHAGAYAGAGARSATLTVNGATHEVTQKAVVPVALRFVPVAPCRVLDTRSGDGGGGLAAGESRLLELSTAGCGLPEEIAAYALNVTAVPQAGLEELSIYAGATTNPGTVTLRSPGGQTRTAAAVVSSGDTGRLKAYATDAVDVVLDVNGYFTAAAAAGGLEFFPVAPCRVIDTRGPAGELGGPGLKARSARMFAVRGACGLPSEAEAYALNLTAIAPGPLAGMTVWPSGELRPAGVTLSAPAGGVTSNAAVVRAGSGGAINVHVSDDAELVADVSGYFGRAGSGGSTYHAVPPCRVADVELNASSLVVAVADSNCGVPKGAVAYQVVATVEPAGPLGYLTLWPAEMERPVVATLSAVDGQASANSAVVAAGRGGAIQAYVSGAARVILEVVGYYAP